MQQTIILMRHGEPIGGKRYRGDQIDDPLSPLGWQQMQAYTQELYDFSLVVSSPMQRCLTFAQWFAEKHNIPLITEDKLREIGLGHWEGLSHQAVEEQYPKELLASKINPLSRPQGGENLEQFQDRVLSAFYQHTQNQSKVFIISHSGVIRTIALHILNAPLSSWHMLKIPFAGIISIHKDHQGVNQITWHNNT